MLRRIAIAAGVLFGVVLLLVAFVYVWRKGALDWK